MVQGRFFGFQKRFLNNQRTCFDGEKPDELINKKEWKVIWYDIAFVKYCIIISIFTTSFSQIYSFFLSSWLKVIFFCPFLRQNHSSFFSLDIPNNLFNIAFYIVKKMVRRLYVDLTREHVVGSCVSLKSTNLEISRKHYGWMLC